MTTSFTPTPTATDSGMLGFFHTIEKLKVSTQRVLLNRARPPWRARPDERSGLDQD